MSGLEFMVAFDPSEGGTKVENSGVWVIRKQVRRKRVGGGGDEVQVLAVYFMVGECVYMAPKMGDVLGGRMVCVPLRSSRPGVEHADGEIAKATMESSMLTSSSFQQSPPSQNSSPQPPPSPSSPPL